MIENALRDPDLLVLDEPTVGLDVETRRRLWQEIRTYVEGGRSVLLTTHYLEEGDALADRVVVIHHGRILAEGTPAEIKARTASSAVRGGCCSSARARCPPAPTSRPRWRWPCSSAP
ncbi:MAG TPA: AAA family ATPase [Thermoanaerobaculia bacterium]|nr:AAA family ATPase [Thermoanaerobaculia bacterium]